MQTHSHEGSERTLASDFYTITGQLPTPIQVWIRANIPRFTNAPTRSNSNPVSPRESIPTARQSTPSMPVRAAKPSKSLEYLNRTRSPALTSSRVIADLAPLAALEKLESIEVVEQTNNDNSAHPYPLLKFLLIGESLTR